MLRHVFGVFFLCALVAAGCGEEEPEPSSGGAPAITTGRPYELGGADGSGADGEEAKAPRGGVAAGPDNVEPGDRPDGDSEFKPPRDAGDVGGE